MIQWRADLKNVIAVKLHFSGSFVRFDPHAFHARVNLASHIRPHPAAGTVAQIFRTAHWAGHACEVQGALPAHFAIEHGLLDKPFRDTKDNIGPVIPDPLHERVQAANNSHGKPIGRFQYIWMIT